MERRTVISKPEIWVLIFVFLGHCPLLVGAFIILSLMISFLPNYNGSSIMIFILLLSFFVSFFFCNTYMCIYVFIYTYKNTYTCVWPPSKVFFFSFLICRKKFTFRSWRKDGKWGVKVSTSIYMLPFFLDPLLS